jgi:hypothetical protein
MKQLKWAFVVLALATCSITIAQTKTVARPSICHIDEYRFGPRGNAYEEVKWEEWEETDINATISGTHVSFDNKGKTSITTGEIKDDEHYDPELKCNTISWHAVDNVGKKCIFRMTIFDDGTEHLMIFYADFVICYQHTEGEEDSDLDRVLPPIKD